MSWIEHWKQLKKDDTERWKISLPDLKISKLSEHKITFTNRGIHWNSNGNDTYQSFRLPKGKFCWKYRLCLQVVMRLENWINRGKLTGFYFYFSNHKISNLLEPQQFVYRSRKCFETIFLYTWMKLDHSFSRAWRLLSSACSLKGKKKNKTNHLNFVFLDKKVIWIIFNQLLSWLKGFLIW